MHNSGLYSHSYRNQSRIPSFTLLVLRVDAGFLEERDASFKQFGEDLDFVPTEVRKKGCRLLIVGGCHYCRVPVRDGERGIPERRPDSHSHAAGTTSAATHRAVICSVRLTRTGGRESCARPAVDYRTASFSKTAIPLATCDAPVWIE